METQLKQAVEALRARLDGFVPEVTLILGSGLGFLSERVENAVVIPYAEIPHVKASTAPGHLGNLVCGQLAGKAVALMQGRVHYYEGYSFAEITFLLRALRLLGSQTLLLTNAAGGVNTDFNVGDCMMITDHIKLFDESPLRGANMAALGTRFPDMSYAYTPRLRGIARQTAATQDIQLREGVYMFFPGPQYETPAEIRMARVLGADAVGMSTVPEVIAAVHAGYEVLGFSVISNMAAGVLPQRLSEQDVLDAAEQARPLFTKLILGCLQAL